MQRLVPAHVARHNPVAAAPVLNTVREAVARWVGGGFGYICEGVGEEKAEKGKDKGDEISVD